jgi:hypothetical protein
MLPLLGLGSDELSTETERKRCALKKPVMEMLQGDATNAGYRVAANTITKATRGALVGALEAQGGDSGAVEMAKAVLKSPEGKAIVGLGLGYAATYAPGQLSELPHMPKIAEELRVEAMAEGGTLILEAIGQQVMPALSDLVAKLPFGADVAKKVRVHEEEESDAAILSAMQNKK